MTAATVLNVVMSARGDVAIDNTRTASVNRVTTVVLVKNVVMTIAVMMKGRTKMM